MIQIIQNRDLISFYSVYPFPRNQQSDKQCEEDLEVDHEHYDFQRGNLSAHTMPHNPYCDPASSIREDVPRMVFGR